MSIRPSLPDYLQQNLLVGDGAMATWLYQQGISIGICVEELCLSEPELVKDVHRSYYAAGARLIETNTFAAHREALQRCGLADQVYRINWKAAVLAREAIGEAAFVVGSMSSVKAGRVGEVRMRGYREQFEEQAAALLSGPIDGLMLETFFDLEELLLAVQVIRPMTDLPLIAQLACLEVGRTRDGYSLSEAFAQLWAAGVEIAGLNCRLGPAEILRCLEQSLVPEGLLLSVFPNAGRLGLTDGEYRYASGPEYFGRQALRFREQGVRLIGGCCGTDPAHIREVAKALQGLPPLPRINPPVVTGMAEKRVPAVEVGEHPPTILDRLASGYAVIVEFDPPKDFNIEGYLQGAACLQAAGADAVTMADNSLAQIRMSNLALGAIVKQRLGIDPLVHITCRDRNLLGQQSHLMGLHALGIHQVLVVTGDPTRYGDLPGSSSVFDVSSFELIRMVKQLNQGISFSGKQLDQRARFIVGAAFNPHVTNFDKAIARLEKKVEAGADFIMTQPVYDAAMLRLIREHTRHLPVPVFIGIMPLTSGRNAEFLHNEVPGIRLTDEVRGRLRELSGEAGRQEGLAIATELLLEAMHYFRGIYLITPFAYYEMTAALTRLCREKAEEQWIADSSYNG